MVLLTTKNKDKSQKKSDNNKGGAIMGERIPDEEITKEQIEEWKDKANCRQFNIFNDTNRIIVLLCRKILKLMKEQKEK